MKRYYTHFVFVRQLCVQFFQCCIGMIGDKLAHFFFVGGEFEFRSAFESYVELYIKYIM